MLGASAKNYFSLLPYHLPYLMYMYISYKITSGSQRKGHDVCFWSRIRIPFTFFIPVLRKKCLILCCQVSLKPCACTIHKWCLGK